MVNQLCGTLRLLQFHLLCFRSCGPDQRLESSIRDDLSLQRRVSRISEETRLAGGIVIHSRRILSVRLWYSSPERFASRSLPSARDRRSAVPANAEGTGEICWLESGRTRIAPRAGRELLVEI